MAPVVSEIYQITQIGLAAMVFFFLAKIVTSKYEIPGVSAFVRSV